MCYSVHFENLILICYYVFVLFSPYYPLERNINFFIFFVVLVSRFFLQSSNHSKYSSFSNSSDRFRVVPNIPYRSTNSTISKIYFSLDCSTKQPTRENRQSRNIQIFECCKYSNVWNVYHALNRSNGSKNSGFSILHILHGFLGYPRYLPYSLHTIPWRDI